MVPFTSTLSFGHLLLICPPNQKPTQKTPQMYAYTAFHLKVGLKVKDISLLAFPHLTDHSYPHLAIHLKTGLGSTHRLAMALLRPPLPSPLPTPPTLCLSCKATTDQREVPTTTVRCLFNHAFQPQTTVNTHTHTHLLSNPALLGLSSTVRNCCYQRGVSGPGSVPAAAPRSSAAWGCWRRRTAAGPRGGSGKGWRREAPSPSAGGAG